MNKYRVVFDLECTCWEDRKFDNKASRIIQIGAVKYHAKSFDIVSTLNLYVYSGNDNDYEITEFCTNLTGITKKTLVDCGDTFTAQYDTFMEWAKGGKYGTNTLLSWGRFDYDMLLIECRKENILPLPKARQFLDAKDIYFYMTGIRASGLEKRLKADKIPYDKKSLHNALYDSECTVMLLKHAYTEF